MPTYIGFLSNISNKSIDIYVETTPAQRIYYDQSIFIIYIFIFFVHMYLQIANNPGYYRSMVEQSLGKETLATEEIERDLHRFVYSYVNCVLIVISVLTLLFIVRVNENNFTTLVADAVCKK